MYIMPPTHTHTIQHRRTKVVGRHYNAMYCGIGLENGKRQERGRRSDSLAQQTTVAESMKMLW